jgi:WD40 repeat protein
VVDVQTGKVVLPLKGLDLPSNGLAFSPDGQRLAGADGAVKVWNVRTGEAPVSFKGGGLGGGGNNHYAVAFSPDGTRLATTRGPVIDDSPQAFSSRRPVKGVEVWNAHTGKNLFTIESAFNCVAFSPDGKSLASCSDDNTVKVWDAETGKELLALKRHTATVRSVAFSPDGKRLASAGSKEMGLGGRNESEAVNVWDTQTGEKLLSIPGGGRRVAFSPDGKLLACGGARGADNMIQIRDAQTGRELFNLKGDTVGVHTLAFSAEGTRLAAAASGAVRVWDVRIANNPLILRGGKPPFAFSSDGKRLASAGDTAGEVKLWDALTGEEQLTLKATPITSLAFHPDGKRLATANGRGFGRGEVRVSDAQTGENILAFPSTAEHVVFSPDGKTLVGTINEAPGAGGVRGWVWDAQTGKLLRDLTPTSYGNPFRVGVLMIPSAAAFSPDGKRLAYTYTPGRTTVWDVETGRKLRDFEKGLVFSPDGKMGASGGEDSAVTLSDAETGERVRTLKGHTHDIKQVAFSPDGKRLASTAADGTVKVWDAETGQELLSLKGGGGHVAFSPDGHRLAAGAREGGVAIWDATPVPEKP